MSERTVGMPGSDGRRRKPGEKWGTRLIDPTTGHKMRSNAKSLNLNRGTTAAHRYVRKPGAKPDSGKIVEVEDCATSSFECATSLEEAKDSWAYKHWNKAWQEKASFKMLGTPELKMKAKASVLGKLGRADSFWKSLVLTAGVRGKVNLTAMEAWFDPNKGTGPQKEFRFFCNPVTKEGAREALALVDWLPEDPGLYYCDAVTHIPVLIQEGGGSSILVYLESTGMWLPARDTKKRTEDQEPVPETTHPAPTHSEVACGPNEPWDAGMVIVDFECQADLSLVVVDTEVQTQPPCSDCKAKSVERLRTQALWRPLADVEFVVSEIPPPIRQKCWWQGGKGVGLRPNMISEHWEGSLWHQLHVATNVGAKGFEMYEARESCLIGHDLRAGAIVFSRKGEDHPGDSRRYVSGALKLQSVRSLRCHLITDFELSLTPIRTITAAEGEYEYAFLELAPNSRWRLPFRNVMSAECKSVYIAEPRRITTMKEVMKKTPSTEAGIRLSYGLIHEQLPLELQGHYNSLKQAALSASKDEEVPVEDLDAWAAARTLMAVKRGLSGASSLPYSYE